MPASHIPPFPTPRRAVVIGSGFAGLSAACCLAHTGWSVTVLEKNDQLGGRARTWETDGFTFDLGPSWYWMPDVFESFFARFGKKPSDYYELVRLDPGYRVFFGRDETIDVAASMTQIESTFESIEPGSASRLRRFLADAAYKYDVGMNDYVRRPSLSWREFLDPKLLRACLRLQMLTPMRSHVARTVRDPRLRQLLEFPVLFLGGTARQIPAMYSLMNHADFALGTWYPKGGMRKIADALISLAGELGVDLRPSTEARQIIVDDSGRATGVLTDNETLPADTVIGAGDYHHVEQHLLEPGWRTYTQKYWASRTLSPSSLLFFVGLNKRLTGLAHHNLIFDEGIESHADEIYRDPKWPTKPLFYVCAPSVTDPGVAPDGCENLFLLMPVAVGLSDPDETRERYWSLLINRLEALTGQSIRDSVVVRRSYAHTEFTNDYHSFRGNAYGLANTLAQTAIFKPRLQSRKVKNLYYAGQLTVPGPGVPPSLISGQIVADLITGHVGPSVPRSTP